MLQLRVDTQRRHTVAIQSQSERLSKVNSENKIKVNNETSENKNNKAIKSRSKAQNCKTQIDINRINRAKLIHRKQKPLGHKLQKFQKYQHQK